MGTGDSNTGETASGTLLKYKFYLDDSDDNGGHGICPLETRDIIVVVDSDPHLVWEREWRTLWTELATLMLGDDEAAQDAASVRCRAVAARIMSTPVRTPQGAAAQIRIALEEQMDFHVWLPDLPRQLDRMSLSEQWPLMWQSASVWPHGF